MRDKKACANQSCPYSPKPGALLDYKSFYHATKNLDGLDSYCKGCRQDKNRQTIMNDPQRVERWGFGTRGRRDNLFKKAGRLKHYDWMDKDKIEEHKYDKRRKRKTESQRQKIAEALKGNKHAIGNKSNTGRKMSEDSNLKRSIAMRRWILKNKKSKEYKPLRWTQSRAINGLVEARVWDNKTRKWIKPAKSDFESTGRKMVGDAKTLGPRVWDNKTKSWVMVKK